MSAVDENQRKLHFEFLRDRIYKTKTKWPHFDGMLSFFLELADSLPDASVVVDLERSYVYGGTCLFAPLFYRQKVIAVDCILPTAMEKFGYQADWANDARCVRWPPDSQCSITKLDLDDQSADVLLVPNVIHHVRDQDDMFKELARILKPNGKGYIFEALVRELHQVPYDYVRYTPYGFDYQLERHGFKMTRWIPTTGVFDVIAYSWIQALDFIPEEDRRTMSDWFYAEEFPRLQELDKRYRTNLVNPEKSFPMAFIIEFQKKPAGATDVLG